MRLSIAVEVVACLSCLLTSYAFNTNSNVWGRTLVTRLSSSVDDQSVPIVITGKNIEVTPSLTEYVNKKFEKTIGKLSGTGAVIDCDVHFEVVKNPKDDKKAHKVEVTTNVVGTILRIAETSADMYATIDLVADRLARKLRKYKERRLEGFHAGPNLGAKLGELLEGDDFLVDDASVESNGVSNDDVFVDPEAPEVTKIKSFDLSNPISLQEAIFALDYIDHDFYVYRDQESGEINVVYKRNAGGVGLIQPQ